MMMAETTTNSPAEQTQENAPRSSSIHNGANLLMELFSTELASTVANIHMTYKQQIETAKATEDRRVAELQQALTDREGLLATTETRIQQISKENAELLHTHQQLLQEFSDFRCAADISRKTSVEVSEQQTASLVADRDDAKSEAAAKQVEIQQLRSDMAAQKLEREALTERVRQLEGEGALTRENYAKADVERSHARDDAAEARGALARLRDALSTIGLESVQDSEGSKILYSKEIGPLVADLLNEGQKAQAISQALASIQDLPGSTKKLLSPGALSPFNLATFITTMKDILSDVAVAGSGWEALYRSKEKEGNVLREQRNTLSSQLSRIQEAKDAAVKEWTEIKSSLAPAGLACTDSNTIVFTKELVSSLEELVPMKIKLGQVAKALNSKGPNQDLEGLLQIEPNLSTSHDLVASMSNWLAIAQIIGDFALALYLSKEEEITKLSVGRNCRQIKETESQLKKPDAQSQRSSSISNLQSTLKQRESSRSSTLPSSQGASSSSHPSPGPTKSTNQGASDSSIRGSPLRQPTNSKNPRHSKQPSSISVPTTSATPRKRSPSVIIVGDSDDEIDSKQTASKSKDSVRSTKKSRRSLTSIVVSEDEKESVGRATPKAKPRRPKPPSKNGQMKKGLGKKS